MSRPSTAEVSSIADSVDALRARVSDLLARHDPDDEEVQAAFHEAERSLASATRHLERARRRLG